MSPRLDRDLGYISHLVDESSPVRTLDSGAPGVMGKYSPFARLDSGGMADVFVAVARGPAGFNKLAVIKRLRNAGDPDHVRMFLDEARLCARLSHPNIVNTYEVGESKGNHFMALEYLDGQPLEALLAKLGARSEGAGASRSSRCSSRRKRSRRSTTRTSFSRTTTGFKRSASCIATCRRKTCL